MMTFKEKIHSRFLDLLNEKIDGFQFTLDELSESILNETKSSAGDKHETALTMLQLEQSQVATHLYEAVDQKTIYAQIDITISNEIAASGSLVKTNKGYFFLSVALPKISIDEKIIFAISPKSPLGEKLMGKKLGDIIEVNGIEHHIESIL
jgi:hypothetical protein